MGPWKMETDVHWGALSQSVSCPLTHEQLVHVGNYLVPSQHGTGQWDSQVGDRTLGIAWDTAARVSLAFSKESS